MLAERPKVDVRERNACSRIEEVKSRRSRQVRMCAMMEIKWSATMVGDERYLLGAGRALAVGVLAVAARAGAVAWHDISKLPSEELLHSLLTKWLHFDR